MNPSLPTSLLNQMGQLPTPSRAYWTTHVVWPRLITKKRASPLNPDSTPLLLMLLNINFKSYEVLLTVNVFYAKSPGIMPPWCSLLRRTLWEKKNTGLPFTKINSNPIEKQQQPTCKMQTTKLLEENIREIWMAFDLVIFLYITPKISMKKIISWT